MEARSDPETLWSTHRTRWSYLWVVLSAVLNTCGVVITRSMTEADTLGSTAGIVELLSSALLVVGSAVAVLFLSSRFRAVTNYVSFILLSAGVSFAVITAWLAAEDATARWRNQPCPQRELVRWGITSQDFYRMTLSLWVAVPTFPAIMNTFQMTRPFEAIRSSSWEHSLRKSPRFRTLRSIAARTTAILSALVSPLCLRRTDKPGKRHRLLHHGTQFFVEVALLELALVSARKDNIWPVGTAIVGSAACMLARFFGRGAAHALMLGILLNLLAFMSSALALVADIGRLSCPPVAAESALLIAADVVLFTVVANLLRLNSMLHAYIEFCEQIWAWISSKVNGAWPAQEDIEHARYSSYGAIPTPGTLAEPAPRRRRVSRRMVAWLLVGLAAAVAVLCALAILVVAPGVDVLSNSQAVDCRVDGVGEDGICSLGEFENKSLSLGHQYRFVLNLTLPSRELITRSTTSPACYARRPLPGPDGKPPFTCYYHAPTRTVYAGKPEVNLHEVAALVVAVLSALLLSVLLVATGASFSPASANATAPGASVAVETTSSASGEAAASAYSCATASPASTLAQPHDRETSTGFLISLIAACVFGCAVGATATAAMAIVYLLECLQKTPPPVLIFCENKNDVDDILEYLLIKGVDACAIHGSKDQEERERAVREFKEGRRDVLIATDIASKGLDFPNIQHVINFDMPKEIDSYVHRIGRTGRCGKTGVATTFINKSVPETMLLDLKHLLMEAKQRVPNILLAIHGPEEELLEGDDGSKGCLYCGGLGHRTADCPKMMMERMKQGRSDDRIMSGRGIGGEM
eukprot:m51a1_g3224 putative atp-dependent rna helicase ddx41 (811) ;mRNA; r:76642-86777